MRYVRTLVAVGAAALVWTGGASSQVPEPALEECVAAVGFQIERGIQSGGGPKSAEPGPINCDMYWFFVDAIGNENSGGPLAP